MIATSFQNVFDTWLDNALAHPVPANVIAFSFNLAEPWSIEIVGAEKFSSDDADWACPPHIWRGKVNRKVGLVEFRNLDLPGDENEDDWESVLEGAKTLVLAYLNRPSPGSDRLREAEAVVVGFVDGELHKVWPK